MTSPHGPFIGTWDAELQYNLLANARRLDSVNRTDFQSLARTRLQDAQALLQAGRCDGAYYLFGLAIECALKACICRKTRRYDFPDRDLTNQSYKHDLAKLVDAAGLESTLDAAMKADTQFSANWLVVKDWTIESRYFSAGPTKTNDIRAAITDTRHGVMRWIRQHW